MLFGSPFFNLLQFSVSGLSIPVRYSGGPLFRESGDIKPELPKP
jgi:hypothetical protein